MGLEFAFCIHVMGITIAYILNKKQLKTGKEAYVLCVNSQFYFDFVWIYLFPYDGQCIASRPILECT
jgi:hypothetical protein